MGLPINVRFPGVKQTSQIYGAVSANDPIRTVGEDRQHEATSFKKRGR